MDTAQQLGEQQPFLKRLGQAFTDGIEDLKQNVHNIGKLIGIAKEDYQRKKQPLYREVPSREAEQMQMELSERPQGGKLTGPILRTLTRCSTVLPARSPAGLVRWPSRQQGRCQCLCHRWLFLLPVGVW